MISSEESSIYPNVAPCLSKQFVWAPGSCDFASHPAIFFPEVFDDAIPIYIIDIILKYFFHKFYDNCACVIVIDRRKSSWNRLKRLVDHLNDYYFECVYNAYILPPTGFIQRYFAEKTMNIQHDVKFPIVILDNMQELFTIIPKSDIPCEFGGTLNFKLNTWIEFQIEIEAYVKSSCELGQRIQAFVSQLVDMEKIARMEVVNDGDSRRFKFIFNPECVGEFRRQRGRLLRQLDGAEKHGMRIRKRLRNEADTYTVLPESQLPVVSSLDLPVDRRTQIIAVEPVIVQLSENRSRFQTFWMRFKRILRNLCTIQQFEIRYQQLQPLLGVWESLIESVTDYLPGRSAAPFPLMSSGSGRNSSCANSDSAIGCGGEEEEEDEFHEEDNSLISGGGGGIKGVTGSTAEDSMEGLLATQKRGIEAECMAASLMNEILDLVALGKIIKKQCLGSDGDSQKIVDSRRNSSTLSINLLSKLTLDGKPWPAGYDIHDEGHDEVSSNCDSVEGTDEDEDSEEDPSPPKTPEIPDIQLSYRFIPQRTISSNAVDKYQLISLIPVYIDNRLNGLKILEELASHSLTKAVSQLNRLVQLYAEIHEARRWVSKGNALLHPLNQEMVARMDPGGCEATIYQLNTFAQSKELNLILKGDPRQFRRQFADLLDAEMKVELSQMLRLVDEVEHALVQTVANLRQQISRNAYPLPRPPLQSQKSSAKVYSRTIPSGSGDSPSNDLTSSPSSTDKENGTGDHSGSHLKQMPQQTQQQRFAMAWQEMIDTERNHIKFLQAVTEVFCAEQPALPPLPPVVRDNRHLLVVNIPEQLVYHRDFFLPKLLECNGKAEEIQKWAKQCFSMLVDLYTEYCIRYERSVQCATALERDVAHSNWMGAYNRQLNAIETSSDPDGGDDDGRLHRSVTRSDSCIAFSVESSNDDGIVREMEGRGDVPLPPSTLEINSQTQKSVYLTRTLLPFSCRLLAPAQRFQRYHLLIDRLKCYAPDGPDKIALSDAHQCMLDMCNTINALMRIRGLAGRPSRLGRLLLQDVFTVQRDDEKLNKHQRTVFLFENALLLSKLRPAPTAPSLVSVMFTNFLNTSNLQSGSSGGWTAAASNSASAPGTLSSGGGFVSDDTDSNSSFLSPTTASCGGNVVPHWSDHQPTGSSYEVKTELSLVEIGLTPTDREDHRRFALWTANRAQTYFFQSPSNQKRSCWVRAINELLSAQLKRLRDEVHQKHGAQIYSSSASNTLDHHQHQRHEEEEESDDFAITNF